MFVQYLYRLFNLSFKYMYLYDVYMQNFNYLKVSYDTYFKGIYKRYLNKYRDFTLWVFQYTISLQLIKNKTEKKDKTFCL